MSTQETIYKDEQGNATFTDEQLRVFGEVFPGFDDWYRNNYDHDGYYVGAGMSGLRRRDDDGRGEG